MVLRASNIEVDKFCTGRFNHRFFFNLARCGIDFPAGLECLGGSSLAKVSEPDHQKRFCGISNRHGSISSGAVFWFEHV